MKDTATDDTYCDINLVWPTVLSLTLRRVNICIGDLESVILSRILLRILIINMILSKAESMLLVRPKPILVSQKDFGKFH